MAEAEPVKVDAPPPPKQSIWTRKFGPLPGWGWAAVAAVGAAGYMWYRNRSSSSSTTGTGTSSTSQTSTGTGGTDYAPQLATLGAEIQQLQGAESTDTASSSTGTTPTGTTGHASKHPAAPKHHKRKTREITVHRGDTLSGIARRHHMSLRKLEKANPRIKNPNLIYPGEKVKL